MNSATRFRRCLFPLALAAVVACGCVRTVAPVLKDEQVTTDDSLAGRWVSKDGKQSADVQAAGPDKTCRVAYTDEDGKTGNFLVRLGKVGDYTVAEIRPDDLPADASGAYKDHWLRLYSFLIVHQTRPQLVLSSMKDDWLAKYVEAHPDELKVIKRDQELIVASTTDEFQAFLLKHLGDDGATGDKATFYRSGDPTSRP